MHAAGVDLVAEFLSCGAGGGREILSSGGVQDSARGADDQAIASSGLSVLHDLGDIATLRTHTRYQQRHVAHDLANFRQLARIGRADDQQAIAARVPPARREVRYDMEQTSTV